MTWPFFVFGNRIVPTCKILHFFSSCISGKLLKKLSAKCLKSCLLGKEDAILKTTFAIVLKLFVSNCVEVPWYISKSYKEPLTLHRPNILKPHLSSLLGIYCRIIDCPLEKTIISSTAQYSIGVISRKLLCKFEIHGLTFLNQSCFLSSSIIIMLSTKCTLRMVS